MQKKTRINTDVFLSHGNNDTEMFSKKRQHDSPKMRFVQKLGRVNFCVARSILGVRRPRFMDRASAECVHSPARRQFREPAVAGAHDPCTGVPHTRAKDGKVELGHASAVVDLDGQEILALLGLEPHAARRGFEFHARLNGLKNMGANRFGVKGHGLGAATKKIS